MQRVELHDLGRVLKGDKIVLLKSQGGNFAICDARSTKALLTSKDVLVKGQIISLLVNDKSPFNRFVYELPSIVYDIIDTLTKSMIIIVPGAQGVSQEMILSENRIPLHVSVDSSSMLLLKSCKFPIAMFPVAKEKISDLTIDHFVELTESSPGYDQISIIELGSQNEITVIKE